MADTGVRQISVILGRSAVSKSARSQQGGVRCLYHEGHLNSRRRIEKKAGVGQNDFPLSLIVVIEQWICLVLGIVCIVSGILGISMNLGQNALPVGHAWSGWVYVLVLRITAAVCLALGVVLVRLGWTSP